MFESAISCFHKGGGPSLGLLQILWIFRETWLAPLVISYQLSIPGVSSSPLPPPPLGSCTAAGLRLNRCKTSPGKYQIKSNINHQECINTEEQQQHFPKPEQTAARHAYKRNSFGHITSNKLGKVEMTAERSAVGSLIVMRYNFITNGRKIFQNFRIKENCLESL